jgi:hypothetical protein
LNASKFNFGSQLQYSVMHGDSIDGLNRQMTFSAASTNHYLATEQAPIVTRYALHKDKRCQLKKKIDPALKQAAKTFKTRGTQ